MSEVNLTVTPTEIRGGERRRTMVSILPDATIWFSNLTYAELVAILPYLTHARGCIERGEEVRFCPEPLEWVDHDEYASSAPGGWWLVMTAGDADTTHPWDLSCKGEWKGSFHARDEAKAKAK